MQKHQNAPPGTPEMTIFLFPKIAVFKKSKTFQKFLFQACFSWNPAYICPTSGHPGRGKDGHGAVGCKFGQQSWRVIFLVLMKSYCGKRGLPDNECMCRISTWNPLEAASVGLAQSPHCCLIKKQRHNASCTSGAVGRGTRPGHR